MTTRNNFMNLSADQLAAEMKADIQRDEYVKKAEAFKRAIEADDSIQFGSPFTDTVEKAEALKKAEILDNNLSDFDAFGSQFRGMEEDPAPRAPDLLDAAAKTFRERNAIYGDTYLNFGIAAAACFPDGLVVKPGDTRAFNRLGLFVQCLGKLMRYGANIETGGHQDSAHDLCVYAAMLEEVTE
jgi:hypothetical protein